MDALDRAREAKLRSAMLVLLARHFPRPLGEGLIHHALNPLQELDTSPDAIRRTLIYLEDRGLIVVSRSTEFWLATITPAGIDAAETDRSADPNACRHNRLLRLRVLQALDWGRPHGLSEDLIRAALQEDKDLDLNPVSIISALTYLAACGLVIWVDQDRHLARLGPDGVDYLAGGKEPLPGVLQPLEF